MAGRAYSIAQMGSLNIIHNPETTYLICEETKRHTIYIFIEVLTLKNSYFLFEKSVISILFNPLEQQKQEGIQVEK